MPKTYHIVSHFAGLMNKAQSRRQPKGDGSLISLADCENIQIDAQGGISSRDQHNSVMSGTSFSSSFSTEDNERAYIIDSGVLYLLHKDLTKTTLGTVSTQHTEWLEVGTSVFMSTGYLINNDVLLPWAAPVPTQPGITISTGLLQAGQYQITMSAIMPDGRESGTCEVIALNINDGAGINLTGTSSCMVYMTDRNGSVIYEVGVGVTSIVSTAQLTLKSINQSILLSQTVPGGIEKIAYYNQCLHCSIYDPETDSSAIFFSKPFYFHVFDWFSDVISDISGHIRGMYGTPENLIIGTDREILAYNIESGITKLAGYGVAEGKPFAKDRSGRLFCQSLRGACSFNPFNNITLDKFTVPLGGECLTHILDSSGDEFLITITDGTGQPEDTTDF